MVFLKEKFSGVFSLKKHIRTIRISVLKSHWTLWPVHAVSSTLNCRNTICCVSSSEDQTILETQIYLISSPTDHFKQPDKSWRKPPESSPARKSQPCPDCRDGLSIKLLANDCLTNATAVSSTMLKTGQQRKSILRRPLLNRNTVHSHPTRRAPSSMPHEATEHSSMLHTSPWWFLTDIYLAHGI